MFCLFSELQYQIARPDPLFKTYGFKFVLTSHEMLIYFPVIYLKKFNIHPLMPTLKQEFCSLFKMPFFPTEM